MATRKWRWFYRKLFLFGKHFNDGGWGSSDNTSRSGFSNDGNSGLPEQSLDANCIIWNTVTDDAPDAFFFDTYMNEPLSLI